MMKRIATFSLVLALIIAVAGLQLAPAAAAPAAQDVPGAPNANLLPADTALYADFRTNQIPDVVKLLQDITLKVSGTAMPDPFQDIDKSLTQALGRPASWAKDIQPWLGDHLTFGLSLSDDMLQAMVDGKPNTPDYQAILSVKDDAKADALLKEAMARASLSPSAMQTSTDTIGDETVTLYKQSGSCGTNCVSFLQMKGTFAFGSTSGIAKMLDTLKSKKATLNQDANFGKIMGNLKPDDLVSVYITPRIYTIYLAGMRRSMTMMQSFMVGEGTPTPTPMPDNMAQLETIFKAINGQAFGIGKKDKLIYFDFAQSINKDALASIYSTMNLPGDLASKLSATKVSDKFTAQIPAKAIALLQAHGLADLYDGLKAGIQNMKNMSPALSGGMDYNQITRGFTQAEGGFSLVFGSDLRKDVLDGLNGDFALYVTYDAKSTLNVNPRSPAPFDLTFIAEATDAAKVKAFLPKLGVGLKGAGKSTVVSAGTDLYTATTPDGITLSYGLVDSTFILTVGGGLETATAAIKGDGSLSSNAVWKRAQTTAILPTTQLWFVNGEELSKAIKAMVPAAQTDDRGTKQVIALFDLFDSMTLTASPLSDDGTSLGSLQLTMK